VGVPITTVYDVPLESVTVTVGRAPDEKFLAIEPETIRRFPEVTLPGKGVVKTVPTPRPVALRPATSEII